MLKISILKQSFRCFCVVSSYVLFFSPSFLYCEISFKEMFPIFFTFYSTLSPHKSDCHHSTSNETSIIKVNNGGGDHMFLFAMRLPVCTLSWQIINNFPLTLKKLVHWTTNYMGNKSSNQWPPCPKLHWLLLCSFSTCLKCFLMTSNVGTWPDFNSLPPLCSVSFFCPLPFLLPEWSPSALVSPREHNTPSLPIHLLSSLHRLSIL